MIYHGKWQERLKEIECDTLIVDPPFSSRVHNAHNSATVKRLDRAGRSLNYECFSSKDCIELCESFHKRVHKWFVVITDHESARIYERTLRKLGRYVFPPIPFVEVGSRVRLLGDGPSSWTSWMIAARPKRKEFMKWGALSGAYINFNREKKPVVGGKPLSLMIKIVEDYSRPGDLICDPCAGGGTTLLAAKIMRRRYLGCEPLAEHYDIAASRLSDCEYVQSEQMELVM